MWTLEVTCSGHMGVSCVFLLVCPSQFLFLSFLCTFPFLVCSLPILFSLLILILPALPHFSTFHSTYTWEVPVYVQMKIKVEINLNGTIHGPVGEPLTEQYLENPSETNHRYIIRCQQPHSFGQPVMHFFPHTSLLLPPQIFSSIPHNTIPFL